MRGEPKGFMKKLLFLIPLLLTLVGCTSIIGSSDEEIDYSQYINKIWIVEDRDGGAYTNSSFFIEKIEDGKIFGKLSIMSISFPDFFYYNFESSSYSFDFTGTISSDMADCQFSSKDGDVGKIKLTLKEDSKIEADIEYISINSITPEEYYDKLYRDYSETESGKEFLSKLEPFNGVYSFRPYNISDISEEIDLAKINTFETELDTWGNINLVTVVFNGNKPYPMAYITNDNDDIFYKFGVPFQTGSEIIDMTIEDINGDGLNDIKMITSFYNYKTGLIDKYNTEYIEWGFFQDDEGFFYDSKILER